MSSKRRAPSPIADDRGHPRTFRPDGREAVLQLGDVPVRVTSTREAGALVVVYHVEPTHDLRYSYSSTTTPPRLIVDIQFVARGGGDTLRLVYEPTRATETAPPPSSSSPVSGRAPASAAPAAASQPFNQRPDAELSGLNALGIVVEDISAQATACGLNKDAFETALSERLFASVPFAIHIAHYRSECPISPFDRLFLVVAIGPYPIPCTLV